MPIIKESFNTTINESEDIQMQEMNGDGSITTSQPIVKIPGKRGRHKKVVSSS
jgi:hypothetical protein